MSDTIGTAFVVLGLDYNAEQLAAVQAHAASLDLANLGEADATYEPDHAFARVLASDPDITHAVMRFTEGYTAEGEGVS